MILKKHLHIPLVKQQKMDGYGRYRLEIGLVQDICTHLNLQLMKKHKNNTINVTREKFDVGLETDRVIRYKPGYYGDYWIGIVLQSDCQVDLSNLLKQLVFKLLYNRYKSL